MQVQSEHESNARSSLALVKSFTALQHDTVLTTLRQHVWQEVQLHQAPVKTTSTAYES